MASPKVIIFGAIGAVGSSAARTASELGAAVVLAVRDTKNPILGVSANLERVQADLTKPDAVHDAVKATGAKRAFLCHAEGSSDHMRGTIEALKKAGIELVVFLSSFTVSTRANLEDFKPDEPIPYVHAQVEINLREIFGKGGFVAVRPGSSASNIIQIKKELERGVVRIYKPDRKLDHIVPEDIGRVAGTILAKGPQDDERAILLYGPQLWSPVDTARIIAKKLGKDPKIEFIEEQEAYEIFVKEFAVGGVPESFARYLIDQIGKSVPGQNDLWGFPITEEQLHNVEKYSGRKPTTFEEWVEQNKQSFIS
jgi:uncharacterized protein YbjT (DUF2867 family)